MHPPQATARHKGQSLVELALILPILTLLMVGAVDLARVFYVKVTVANSSRVAAEYAARYTVKLAMYAQCPPGGTAAQRETCAKNKATAATKAMAVQEAANLALTTSDVSVNFDNANLAWEPGGRYTVTVRAPFYPITPLAADILGANPLMVTHATKLRHHCARGMTCD